MGEAWECDQIDAKFPLAFLANVSLDTVLMVG